MTEIADQVTGRLAEAERCAVRHAEALSPESLVELVNREAPAGAVIEALALADGTRLRTVRWMPPAPARGTVLICTGRGEFIEKYFEVTRNLLDRNLAVVVFDWRGQGLSSRAVRDRRKGHVGSFRQFGRDLDAVTERVMARHCPAPFYALAHSMGGAVMLHHARSPACRFARIVLSAPMVAIDRLPWAGVVHGLTRALTRVGFGAAFVPQGGRTAVFVNGFEGNVLTTDRRRFADMMAISRAEPRLTIDAPTISWLRAALDAMEPFEDPQFARRLAVPVLMVVPGDDRVVNVAAMERFGRDLKAGTVVAIPGAQHEILMERDALRDQFWAAFDAFVPGEGAGSWRVPEAADTARVNPGSRR